MRYLFTLLFAFACLNVAATTPDGALFEAAKCVKCHSVESQNIATTSKKPDEVKDLSTSGANFDEAQLTAYLKKEAEYDGKMHKYKFKGEDADLAKLVTWLLTLR